MKQTVEEAARENILFNHRTADRTLSGKNLAQFGEINFIQGAEWHAKQSPWISVNQYPPMDKPLLLKYGDGGIDDMDLGFYTGLHYLTKDGQ